MARIDLGNIVNLKSGCRNLDLLRCRRRVLGRTRCGSYHRHHREQRDQQHQNGAQVAPRLK